MKLVRENLKMGFPRILSKNNKIYTKLGEFCLSSDGNNFWILCHTCQEELQSQDHFWKHIQDEHNFLLSLKENVSNRSTTYMDCTEPGGIMPLPLYRKMHSDSEDNVQRNEMADNDEDDSQQEHSQQPKDYTDMRNTLTATTDAVSIDIKVEPPNAVHNNNNNQTIPITTAAAVAAAAVAQQQASNVAAALQLQSQNATIYQLPPVVPPSSSGAYATIVHGMPPAQHTAILKQDLIVPKDTNSATASASSAVSSEDGERWYICDHESCGLKFKYQSRLELHRSVHSKERKYACEICGASFKQSCNLSTHRKKKHFLKGTKSLINLPTQAGQQQQQQPQTTQHHQQQLQQHTQQQHF